MKKIWKIRKNSEAVSPVIATILMVAITVVLAAVLYVMVMGFTPGGGGNTPQGAFVGAAENETAGYRLTFGVITPETTWNQCKFTLTVGGTAMTAVALTLNSGTGTATVTLGTSGKTYTAVITDLAADGKISNGDYVVVKASAGFPTSSTFALGLLFTGTGGQVCSQSWST